MSALEPCRWCGLYVRWVETVKGKRMPLEPDPSADGNFAFTADGRVEYVGKDSLCSPRYKCHLATCTQGRYARSRQVREAADRAAARVRRGL